MDHADLRDDVDSLKQKMQHMELMTSFSQQLEQDLWRYLFIVNASNDLISIVNRDYIYELVNNAYVTIYHRSRESIVGRSVFDIWGSDKFDQLIKPKFEACFAGKLVKDQDWIDCGPAGKRFMDIAYYPYVDENKNVVAAVVISHDITPLKLAETALKESEANYRNLVNNSLDLIVATDADGDFTFLNPVAEQYFRIGKNFLISIHREDLERTRRTWESLIAGQAIKNFENRVSDLKGQTRYLAWSSVPLFDEHNRFKGVSAVARDITNLRRIDVIVTEARLTQREAQIMRLVIQGYTNLNIAMQLEIQESTVKFHLNKIFRKTGTQNRTELTAHLL